MPKVSVVIPVYNAEEYLRECLDTIVNQTLKDVEIICVDDGSTDGSLEILQEYKQIDNRIVILQQKNSGAASARNWGMSLARGKYLLLLDSDDIFDRKLLEKSVAKAEILDSDVTVFKAMCFDTNTGVRSVMKDNISNFRLGKEKAFSYTDIPEGIFNSFLIPAWNKLLKRSFILEHDIRFQNIKRYNDMFFSSKALVLAKKIGLVDEVLLYYRVGLKSNLQSGKDKTPLEVIKPLKALKIFLDDYGIYPDVKKSFLKLALDNIFYNLNEIKNNDVRKCFIYQLCNETFADLDINKCHEIKNISYLSYLQYKCIHITANRTILSVLYAMDKVWEYYRMTGLKNTIYKIILRV